MEKTTFALYFAHRGTFPGSLIKEARAQMTQAVEKAGYNYIIMDEDATPYGAVETTAQGKLYAKFLQENAGKYDGVVVCMPNFGDENGAVEALKNCNVPILIQAYPDEMDKMDPVHRRDAFCGKLSIMDVFYQYELPFTTYKPHVIHPLSDGFRDQLEEFAKVCRVVKGMRDLRIGAIGARTTPFKTVRYDEMTLQRYGVTVETMDTSELFYRMKKIEPSAALTKKMEDFKAFSDFSKVPEHKLEAIAKASLAIDQIIADFQLDAVAIRCWNDIENELGICPCVILGELGERGIPAACEVDVCNAVMMKALSLATGKASTVHDWNNNYADEEDKCILFHCGPVPASMMEQKGWIADHAIISNDVGKGNALGANQGRMKPGVFTYSSARTEDGVIYMYTGIAQFTKDPIPQEFFGCAGVAEFEDLQEVMAYLAENDHRHHVSLSYGNVVQTIDEALGKYLGYEIDIL